MPAAAQAGHARMSLAAISRSSFSVAPLAAWTARPFQDRGKVLARRAIRPLRQVALLDGPPGYEAAVPRAFVKVKEIRWSSPSQELLSTW